MEPRNDRPIPPPPPAPNTPLVWAGGAALLTVSVWLTSMIAMFQGIGSLFR